jgi:hypothetical protein
LESDVSTEGEDGAYHEDGFCHVLRMLTTLLNVSVDNKLATGGISSISEFHDDENFGSNGEEKVRAHMTACVLSFTDTNAAYESVYSIVLHICAHHWQA